MLTWPIQSGDMGDMFRKIKEVSLTDKQIGELFRTKILSV